MCVCVCVWWWWWCTKPTQGGCGWWMSCVASCRISVTVTVIVCVCFVCVHFDLWFLLSPSFSCVCVCRVCCLVVYVSFFRSTWGSFDNFKQNSSPSSSQKFPKTLQDFIQQKQWERFDVETEQKRVRTAHTQRMRAERYAKKYGIDPQKHIQKLFPKSHSMEELPALPHHKAPRSIRMTTKHVPPITKLKYVVFVGVVLGCS